METEDNKAWTIGNTQATLETEEIQPGESKEYKVVMNWQNGEDTVGTKLNTVEIITTSNEADFEETLLEDNKSAASIIVAIGTGETNYILITAGIMIILVAASTIIYKKYKKD